MSNQNIPDSTSTSELNESFVSLVLLGLFPGQDLIDLLENDQSPSTIKFGRHESSSVNPQVRRSNQVRLLLVF